MFFLHTFASQDFSGYCWLKYTNIYHSLPLCVILSQVSSIQIQNAKLRNTFPPVEHFHGKSYFNRDHQDFAVMTVACEDKP